MIDLFLIEMCKVPGVSTSTIAEIIRVESSGNENAININGQLRLSKIPTSRDEAITAARQLISQKANIDIGLMQINSTNFRPLGLTLEAVFDPCTNIKAGTTILKSAYERASKAYGEGQTALKGALSIYNTGNLEAGHTNGYLKKYYYRRDTIEQEAATAEVTVQFNLEQ